MKYIKIGIIFFAIHFSLTAKPVIFYTKGDQLYVLAKAGLNLRVNPAKNARLLQTVSYGTNALVREIPNKEFEVDGIKGYWVKVIADDREGYLFDGYLSSYPPPIAETPNKPLPTLKQYAEKFLPKNTKFSESLDETMVQTSKLLLPFTRLEEAYLLGTKFLYNFEKYKFPTKSEKVNYGETEVEFKIERTKSGEFKSISSKETFIASGGTVTLIASDLGNSGVEIRIIFASP